MNQTAVFIAGSVTIGLICINKATRHRRDGRDAEIRVMNDLTSELALRVYTLEYQTA